MTTLALVLALLTVETLKPGAGMNIDPTFLDTRSVATDLETAKQQSVNGDLLHIIPTTVFSALGATRSLGSGA